MGADSATASADFAIEGMHCGSCSALIEESLVENPAIPEVAVDLGAATAHVAYDPARVSPAEIAAAITGLGYPARPLGD